MNPQEQNQENKQTQQAPAHTSTTVRSPDPQTISPSSPQNIADPAQDVPHAPIVAPLQPGQGTPLAEFPNHHSKGPIIAAIIIGFLILVGCLGFLFIVYLPAQSGALFTSDTALRLNNNNDFMKQ